MRQCRPAGKSETGKFDLVLLQYIREFQHVALDVNHLAGRVDEERVVLGGELLEGVGGQVAASLHHVKHTQVGTRERREDAATVDTDLQVGDVRLGVGELTVLEVVLDVLRAGGVCVCVHTYMCVCVRVFVRVGEWICVWARYSLDFEALRESERVEGVVQRHVSFARTYAQCSAGCRSTARGGSWVWQRQ